jgi:ankyrin repeat protein
MYEKNILSDILSNGANINCTNFFGGTPLIESCRKKEHDEPQRAEFVEFLLKNGANICICDMYGSTALLYAEDNGYESIVKTNDYKAHDFVALLQLYPFDCRCVGSCE